MLTRLVVVGTTWSSIKQMALSSVERLAQLLEDLLGGMAIDYKGLLLQLSEGGLYQMDVKHAFLQVSSLNQLTLRELVLGKKK